MSDLLSLPTMSIAAWKNLDEVLADMKTFAEDKSNVCYPELAGARALLTRQPWLSTF